MKNNKSWKLIVVIIAVVLFLVIGDYVLNKTILKPIFLPTLLNPVNIPIWYSTQTAEKNKLDCMPSISPWIKVLSPNGGETYTIGQQLTVKWQSCNVPESSHDVFVALHQDGEFKNVSYLSNATINDGNEIFTIPSVPSGNYKIRVGSSSARVGQDYSDNFFTINSPSHSQFIKRNKT